MFFIYDYGDFGYLSAKLKDLFIILGSSLLSGAIYGPPGILSLLKISPVNSPGPGMYSFFVKLF